MDIDRVTELAKACDVAWWGEADTDELQVQSWLRRAGSSDRVRLDAHGFAAAFPTGESILIVDPAASAADRAAAYDTLLGWLVGHGVDDIDCPRPDAERMAALERYGFVAARSSFDLERAGSAPLDPPAWPDGVTARPATGDDAEAIHALIYSVWTDVPGHRFRPLDEWRPLFFADERTQPGDHLVAERAGELAGVALTGIFPGPFGWVSQLAVGRGARGLGLGRALLLAALRSLVDRGCPQVGLGVMAENASALGLYRSVGLEPTRETVICLRPPNPPPPLTSS